MSDAPIIYHGVWRIPDARGQFIHQFSGTLTYREDKPSTLELIHEPGYGSIAANIYLDVILGEDARGARYSLFGATLKEEVDFTKSTYLIRFILIGKHVHSLEETCFDSCWVKYPYMNRWALENRISVKAKDNTTSATFDVGSRPPFLSVELETDTKMQFWSRLSDHISRYGVTASQMTDVKLEIPAKGSIKAFLRIIQVFSQFLSIALFAEQNPSEIVFSNLEEENYYSLLFERHPSVEPRLLSFIKYEALKDRIPGILKQWHANYEQMAPISHYLIKSIASSNSFDTPDFLIVAQALDGYYKRFVNHKDSKDTRQYKHQLDKLLGAFKGVEVIRECNLDTEVVKQSRHKYSHLIPDDDTSVARAVAGEELYWLTQKCIVLLTCCILDMLGLSVEEINLCCKGSPIEQIVRSIPLWAK